MCGTPLIALIIEDDLLDFEILAQGLRSAGFCPECRRVETEAVGGRCHVDSEPGHGALVSVLLRSPSAVAKGEQYERDIPATDVAAWLAAFPLGRVQMTHATAPLDGRSTALLAHSSGPTKVRNWNGGLN